MLPIFLEIIIIFVLCIFQSIFGLGLLLFGTPIFLLIGNDFFATLNLLLPVSIVISLMQIYKNKIEFQNKFYILFNTYTIPFLILSLCLLIFFHKKLNFILLISLIIILFSFINIFFAKKSINFFKSFFFNKIVFAIIGIIHGFTNLGGSLLSLTSININSSKSQIRSSIAYGYFIMSIIQILTINFFAKSFMDISKFYLLLIPFIVFTFSQKIYNKINKEKFSLILSLIALFFGICLFFKEVL